jgi:hypothetical protein
MADVKNADDLHRRLMAVSEKIKRAHLANRGDEAGSAREQIERELAGAKSEIENILVELAEVRHGGN